jgi:hypothetical protein
VLVNTLIIQQILAEPEWAGRLTDRDKQALTALTWSHINSYLRHAPHRHEHAPRPRTRHRGRTSRLNLPTARIRRHYFAAPDTNPITGPTHTRASYGVDRVPGGSGGPLESSACAGPSIDSVIADSTCGFALRNDRRRLRCCWPIRSRNCSCRRRWRSVRSRNSRYFRCRSSVSSLVGGIAMNVSEPRAVSSSRKTAGRAPYFVRDRYARGASPLSR